MMLLKLLSSNYSPQRRWIWINQQIFKNW